jgi:protein involved in polysaccharide export with SLBB domain
MTLRRTSRHFLRLLAFFAGVAWCLAGQAQIPIVTPLHAPGIGDNGTEAQGPVRLRAYPPPESVDSDTGERSDREQQRDRDREPPYTPGEFERFVQNQAGPDAEIRRFGSDLVTAGRPDGRDGELSPQVPADYVIGPGDEILLTLWGSVDADLRIVVDRSGRISIPRVGTVQVSGVRNADLPEVINRRVGRVFRNFQSSVSLGQLRGIRIFVTGFALRPGSYTVSSLSTVIGALLKAGGPSAAGSFRDIELRRGKALVGRFDLYDLLLSGDRSADRIVQAGDVVHVGAVGPQIGVIGSVNKPAVFELKPGETIADALRMAGGFTAVADRSRLAVERLEDRNAGRVAQLELPRDERLSLSHGDVLRAFSAVAAALSTQRQSKRIRIEGEVARPGEYVLPPASTVQDALRAAGGLGSAAYLFATEFTRVSVQRTQQENYDRALRDLQTDLARSTASQHVSTSQDMSLQAARSAAASRLIEQLRALHPTGRIVLQMAPTATDLPDLVLEDGDRLFIPPKPTTVGVFGSVFNTGTYLYAEGRTVGDYLRLAGGARKGADEGSIFVVRANGNVISARQSSGWFDHRGDLAESAAEPGDTVFVPEEMDKTTFMQAAKDWTQILYQFGLGIAGLKVTLD